MLHPIFPGFSSSLDLQSRKKMKQESLGPLVISKPARLTTIACRSRAPWLTSASDPALCQKNPSMCPLSLCHCPGPVLFFPKSSAQIPLCDLSAPSPTQKKSRTSSCRRRSPLWEERKTPRCDQDASSTPHSRSSPLPPWRRQIKVAHIEVALNRGVLQQQLASLGMRHCWPGDAHWGTCRCCCQHKENLAAHIKSFHLVCRKPRGSPPICLRPDMVTTTTRLPSPPQWKSSKIFASPSPLSAAYRPWVVVPCGLAAAVLGLLDRLTATAKL